MGTMDVSGGYLPLESERYMNEDQLRYFKMVLLGLRVDLVNKSSTSRKNLHE
ncbi:hypothetical protein [Desulforhopalus singaporensis]|uniref:Uncharacterized protein n=1 Tax=Desulforhopalus singaporensis TaxID=91360 RepID=A0A1H0M8F0_9BACT|nr:hypothetical protein [Desulforhopalus singaporensis]SDO76694.1 hypothetical protein SAMN05660330_01023 [Desulforhopalus singaporensis]